MEKSEAEKGSEKESASDEFSARGWIGSEERDEGEAEVEEKPDEETEAFEGRRGGGEGVVDFVGEGATSRFSIGEGFFLTIQAKHKAKATGSRERERENLQRYRYIPRR